MTAFPSPQAAEQVRARKLPVYGAHNGKVRHWSGELIDRAAAMALHAKYLAQSKDPSLPASHVRHAVLCRQQLEAAIAASFPDQKEPQR